MEKILIGKIVSAVGLKGEVKVYNYSDRPDIYEDTESIYVDDVLMRVRSVRTQKNMVILGLEGIDDRNAAEKARGSELFVTEDDLPEL
ncbi:MAG: 16S rRNA processing protein RimM, partial [Firmicutes bacterium]|nr:16S rRNA processing protein RimM [Bacillota bacterium]